MPMPPVVPFGDFVARLVQHAHVEARNGAAHRAGLDGKQFCVVADAEIALGLAENLVHVDAERRAHPVEQLGAERLAAGDDAAQVDAFAANARLPHQLQRGRREEHVADLVIGHQLDRRLRLELSRAAGDDRHAEVPGRETAR